MNDLRAYGQSKLCNLLFARALSAKLSARGSRVTINAVHTGHRGFDIVVNRKNNTLRWVAWLMRLFFLSCEEGAETSVYLACDPSVFRRQRRILLSCRIEPSSAASQNLENGKPAL
jgi:NAD(P)-dependent dehydrogenase (short-subunit alcohol dehydrogenase family)